MLFWNECLISSVPLCLLAELFQRVDTGSACFDERRVELFQPFPFVQSQTRQHWSEPRRPRLKSYAKQKKQDQEHSVNLSLFLVVLFVLHG